MPLPDLKLLSALIGQAEADYNLRARHPEREGIYADYAARSQRLRERCAPRSLRYGEAPRCTIDWFAPTAAPVGTAPLLVFFHGGFWRGGDKTMFGFIAEPFLAAGACVALVGYELAPAVSVGTIVQQAGDAIRCLMARHAELGFDPARVTVSGHSAGAHLAALLGALDGASLGGHAMAGVVGLSGLYALQPYLLSSVNLETRMTLDEAQRLSPAALPSFAARRFLLAVGARETDGFLQQTAHFARHLEQIGQAHELTVCPGRTHFDLFEDFAAADRPLFRQALSVVMES